MFVVVYGNQFCLQSFIWSEEAWHLW